MLNLPGELLCAPRVEDLADRHARDWNRQRAEARAERRRGLSARLKAGILSRLRLAAPVTGSVAAPVTGPGQRA